MHTKCNCTTKYMFMYMWYTCICACDMHVYVLMYFVVRFRGYEFVMLQFIHVHVYYMYIYSEHVCSRVRLHISERLIISNKKAQIHNIHNVSCMIQWLLHLISSNMYMYIHVHQPSIKAVVWILAVMQGMSDTLGIIWTELNTGIWEQVK